MLGCCLDNFVPKPLRRQFSLSSVAAFFYISFALFYDRDKGEAGFYIPQKWHGTLEAV